MSSTAAATAAVMLPALSLLPEWLLDELQRLLQAMEAPRTRAQACLLLPIHLCGITATDTSSNNNSGGAAVPAFLVAFAFLPSAARGTLLFDMLPTAQHEHVSAFLQSCLLPCAGLPGPTGCRVVRDARELRAVLASAKAIDKAAFLQPLEVAASLAVVTSPRLTPPKQPSDGSENSSKKNSAAAEASERSIAVVVQNQNFETVATKVAAEGSGGVDVAAAVQELLGPSLPAFAPGSALFVTVTELPVGGTLAPACHQTAQAIFRLPGDRRTLAEILHTPDCLRAAIAQQSAFCDRLPRSNDGSASGKVAFQVFLPPLAGSWCPIAVPSFPPALRNAFQRALLLPPCPHLLPARSVIARLQLRTQQHAEAQRQQMSGDVAASQQQQPVPTAAAVSNFPVLQRLNQSRSAVPAQQQQFAILRDPHKDAVKKRWNSISGAQKQQQLQQQSGEQDSDDAATPPGIYTVRGSLLYYHYRVDGFDDKDWGCAYRAAQTLISWFALQADFSSAAVGAATHADNGFLTPAVPEPITVPTITEMQKVLAAVDPDATGGERFVGSKSWIGTFEVMGVLQFLLPDLQCKLIRINKGADFATDAGVLRQLVEHFERSAAPVVVGGASYAHTILGVEVLSAPQSSPSSSTAAAAAAPPYQLLILDPHYMSARKNEPSLDTVLSKGWCSWKKPEDFFAKNEWYNLLMPQVASMMMA